MVFDDDCDEVKVDETFSHSEKQFSGHPRTSNLIHAYIEGIQVSSGMSEVSREQDCNGYELLRQLAREYSLRSRGEALAFRTSLARPLWCPPMKPLRLQWSAIRFAALSLSVPSTRGC